MEVFKLQYPNAPEQVLSLLELPPEQRAILKMGTVQLSKGEWVPPEGYSKHAQHEISFILQGEIEVESAAAHVSMGAGDVIVIPAGEEHRSRARADTRLVWFWFGEEAQ